jgi:hypothetical protein
MATAMTLIPNEVTTTITRTLILMSTPTGRRSVIIHPKRALPRAGRLKFAGLFSTRMIASPSGTAAFSGRAGSSS